MKVHTHHVGVTLPQIPEDLRNGEGSKEADALTKMETGTGTHLEIRIYSDGRRGHRLGTLCLSPLSSSAAERRRSGLFLSCGSGVVSGGQGGCVCAGNDRDYGKTWPQCPPSVMDSECEGSETWRRSLESVVQRRPLSHVSICKDEKQNCKLANP